MSQRRARGPFLDRDTILKHHRLVIACVRKFGVSQEEAPDAAQDVLLAAFLRWKDYRPEEGNVEAWLTGIARRVAANWRRSRRRHPAALWEPEKLDIIIAEQRSPEEAADHTLKAALCQEGTSFASWQIIVAHHVEGVTVEALAEQTGLTIDAIEWRLLVARREMLASIQRLRTGKIIDNQRPKREAKSKRAKRGGSRK